MKKTFGTLDEVGKPHNKGGEYSHERSVCTASGVFHVTAVVYSCQEGQRKRKSLKKEDF